MIEHILMTEKIGHNVVWFDYLFAVAALWQIALCRLQVEVQIAGALLWHGTLTRLGAHMESA